MEDLIDAIDSALFEFTGKPSSINFLRERLSDKRISRIKHLVSGVSVFNEEAWNKMFEFMLQYVPKFEAAFKKPIQLLSRK